MVFKHFSLSQYITTTSAVLLVILLTAFSIATTTLSSINTQFSAISKKELPNTVTLFELQENMRKLKDEFSYTFYEKSHGNHARPQDNTKLYYGEIIKNIETLEQKNQVIIKNSTNFLLSPDHIQALKKSVDTYYSTYSQLTQKNTALSKKSLDTYVQESSDLFLVIKILSDKQKNITDSIISRVEDKTNSLATFIMFMGGIILIICAAITFDFRRTIKTEFARVNMFFDRAAKNFLHLDESKETPEEFNELATHVNSMIEAIQKREKTLLEYQSAIDATCIVSKVDTLGTITYVNDMFCKLSGYTKKELIGSDHSLVRHPDTPDSLYTEIWENLRNGKMWKGVITNKGKGGKDYTTQTFLLPITNAAGKTIEYIAIRTPLNIK